jgi:hypothetical protein
VLFSAVFPGVSYRLNSQDMVLKLKLKAKAIREPERSCTGSKYTRELVPGKLPIQQSVQAQRLVVPSLFALTTSSKQGRKIIL